jgi:hypothetical protein
LKGRFPGLEEIGLFQNHTHADYLAVELSFVPYTPAKPFVVPVATQSLLSLDENESVLSSAIHRVYEFYAIVSKVYPAPVRGSKSRGMDPYHSARCALSELQTYSI